MRRPRVIALSLHRLTAALLVAAGISLPQVAAAQSLPWMDQALSADQRAQLLVNAMTESQKFEQMVGGPGVIPELPQCYGARHVPGIPALQIPTFRITNGPVGIGQNDCVPTSTPGLPLSALTSTASAKATAAPSGTAIAASFDTEVASQFGNLLGVEARNLALHELEGPGVNMARTPEGGRNFEYFGEDPFLAGTMAVNEIRAVQSQGVIAMAKHIVANDQETNRMTINEIVDDRVLHELYLLPFEMAVKDGQVGSVMCSYNGVNGVQMCENGHILNDVLRGQWGFKGYVQSDFFATHTTAASLLAGLDLEMPGLSIGSLGPHFTPALLQAALDNKQITQSNIDTALVRRYSQMFSRGIFDRPVAQTAIDVPGDGAVARAIGEQGAVLLKNSGNLLPLKAGAVHQIAVIGKADYASKAVAGCCGGSSDVIPFYTVTPLQGVQNVLATLKSSASASLTVIADDNSNLAAAVAVAKSADVVIVLAGSISEEGKDLPSITLPKSQDAMISAIAAANPRTVLVLKDNASVLMPWINSVPAVLEAWFPGQEDGNIVADLLFGQTNPSGKTPVTYPVQESDLPTSTHPSQWPGVTVNGQPTATYSEGLLIGYRWFDAKDIEPLFPFGYGLSYTRFAISHLKVEPEAADGTEPVTVQFVVHNTGKVAGAEVAQVYLGLPRIAGEPPKRLVGFRKVFLQPGEKRQVEITIDPDASSHPFQTFDSSSQTWRMAAGTYQVFVGNSSGDRDALLASLPARQASPRPASHGTVEHPH